MTGMMVTVLGDATNVAFRISGLAGRDGRSDVMATKSIYDLTAHQFQFGPPEDVQVKGRTITETLYPLVLPAEG
jgi:adenylate cyclase